MVDQDVARPKGKRSRGGLNFFKFAETVEEGAWDDEQVKKDLEVCDTDMTFCSSHTTLVTAFPGPSSGARPRVARGRFASAGRPAYVEVCTRRDGPGPSSYLLHGGIPNETHASG